jgi:hypothetical protein
MSTKVIALLIALIVSLAAAHASVPIIVSGGAGRRVAMSLSNTAEKQLENGGRCEAQRGRGFAR